jgi:hypothetical protein
MHCHWLPAARKLGIWAGSSAPPYSDCASKGKTGHKAYVTNVSRWSEVECMVGRKATVRGPIVVSLSGNRRPGWAYQPFQKCLPTEGEENQLRIIQASLFGI